MNSALKKCFCPTSRFHACLCTSWMCFGLRPERLTWRRAKTRVSSIEPSALSPQCITMRSRASPFSKRPGRSAALVMIFTTQVRFEGPCLGENVAVNLFSMVSSLPIVFPYGVLGFSKRHSERGLVNRKTRVVCCSYLWDEPFHSAVQPFLFEAIFCRLPTLLSRLTLGFLSRTHREQIVANSAADAERGRDH